MSKPRCPRSWEAEALEDKRLGDGDRESFERHRAGCVECRAATAELEAVRESMAALPLASPTPLVRHRVRAGILRDANRSVTRGDGAPWPVLVAVAVSFSLVALLATVRWHGRGRLVAAPSTSSSGPANTAAGAAPSFTVHADEAARLTTRASGATTVIALEDGRALFEVTHLEPGQRFLVALPDGEVEVRGTSFVIDVATSGTRTIEVHTGRVSLRLVGHDEIVLAAGDRWPPRVADDRIDGGTGGIDPPAGSSARVAATKRHAITAGERFDAAMRRFGAGQYAEADRELAAFAHEHPNDPRCEDAAFLRAVARSRLGDAEGASVNATSYLRAYPHGLRRAEAQHLVDAAAH